VPVVGGLNLLVTQGSVRVLVASGDAKLRATQEPVRALVKPSDAKLRATQEPVRALVFSRDAKLRATQATIRVLCSSAVTVTKTHNTDTYLSSTYVAATSLISYWKLDEPGTGAVAIDSGTSGSNATDNLGNITASTTVPVAAPTNFSNPQGRFLPAVNGTHFVTAVQPLHSFTGNFTVSAWVRTSKAKNSPIVTHENFPYSQGWGLQTDGLGRLISQACTSAGSNILTSEFTLPTGVWFHVAMVMTATTRYLYYNGQKSVNTSNILPAASTGLATSLGWDTANIAANQLNGDLDDVRIYNIPLTDNQVQSLAAGNEPFLVTPTTKVHGTDTVVGPAVANLISWWKLDETGTGAVAIDSAQARVNAIDSAATTTAVAGAPLKFTNPQARHFPDNTNLNVPFTTAHALVDNFTVCAWVRPALFPHIMGIVSRMLVDWGDGWSLFVDSAVPFVGAPGMVVQTPTSGYGPVIHADSVIPLNAWSHVLMVMRSGVRYLYINGIKQSGSDATAMGTSTQPTITTIGRYANDIAAQWVGDLDDVRMYGSALTDDQIQILAGGNDPRNTSTVTKAHGTDTLLTGLLLSYYPFDEIGTGKTAIDVQPLGANATDHLGLTVNSTLAPVAAPVSFPDPTGRKFVATDHNYLTTGVVPAHGFNGSFTVSAWVRVTAGHTNGVPIVCHFSQGNVFGGWALRTSNTGQLSSYVISGGSAYIILGEASFVLQPGIWTHCCATFIGQGSGPRGLYFNGRKSVNSLVVGQMPGANANLPTTFGQDYSDTPQSWLDGDLDDVRLYRVGMSDDQVQSLAGGNDPFLVTLATKSHKTDVLLVPFVVFTRTTAHTTSTVPRATANLVHTCDTLHNGTFTRPHTTGSYLRATFIRAHSTNTLCRGTLTHNYTTDNLARSTTTIIHTTDASRIGTFAPVHTTGSQAKATFVLPHSSSTTMQGTVTWTHNTNSWLLKAVRSPGFRGMMAIWLGGAVRRTMIIQTVHGTDTMLVYSFATGHSSDVDLKGAVSSSHTADTTVSRMVTVSMTQTTDADLKGVVTKVHRTSSLVCGTFTKLHTVDALVHRTVVLAHSTDSDIASLLTQQQAHTTDADLSGHAFRYHFINLLARSTSIKAHNSDTSLHFTFICAHSTDSRIAALGIYTQVHTTDADLAGTVTQVHTTNALAYITSTKAHTMDAKAVNTYIRTHNTNALLRHPNTKTHTTDMSGKRAYLRGHTTSSRLAGTRAVVHSTDAGFSYVTMVNGQTDALVRASLIRKHTTDTRSRRIFIRAHSTSSWCQILPIRNHHTDASLWWAHQLPNYTDWLVRGTIERSHNTDLWYCNIVAAAHSTNVLRLGERTHVCTTDSVLATLQFTSHGTDTLPLVVPIALHGTDAYVAHTKSWSHGTWSLTTRVPIAGRWTTPRVGTRPLINVVSKNRQEAGSLYPVGFLLVGFDRITPILGAKPTVQLLKSGGSWVPAVGVVTEVGDGWYQLTLDPADCPVTGEYVLRATDPNAEASWTKFDVVVPDPYSPITLAQSERDAIADATLTRVFASVAARWPRCMLRAVQALWYWKTAPAKPLTVVNDDGTVAWQADVIVDPTIPPIRGMTPQPPP
jgi:hypothetical protein